MAFNGSGTYSLYATGNPVVTNTTISSTWANNTLNDIATGLSTCVCKDGQQTVTASIPMSGFKFTGLGPGSASGHSLRYEQVNGIVTTAGDILQASAAGALARLALGTAGQFPAVNAGATALAYQSMATQADQETGTSILAPVTPGTQQYHTSAAKFWVKAGVTGNILASYNMTSVTDVGTGVITITIATDFSSVQWCAQATIEGTVAGQNVQITNGGLSAGAITNLLSFNAADDVATDPNSWHAMGLGDQ